MTTEAKLVAALCAGCFAAGAALVLLLRPAAPDFDAWRRTERDPLLVEIATLRHALDSAAAVRARAPIAPPVPRPATRPPVPPEPTPDASAAVWRADALRIRADLATEREARERAERQAAEYGERARQDEILLARVTAIVPRVDTVLRDVPRPHARWLTAEVEALALLGGGMRGSVAAVALPGRLKVLAFASSETDRGARVGVGVRYVF